LPKQAKSTSDGSARSRRALACTLLRPRTLRPESRTNPFRRSQSERRGQIRRYSPYNRYRVNHGRSVFAVWSTIPPFLGLDSAVSASRC
jgi:hypothetical protein